MMSSQQYPTTRTIINIRQDENLQKKKVQSYETDRNRFQRQVYNSKASEDKHLTTSSMYGNIASSNKILIPYEDEDQAASLVSELPSLDSDGKNFTSRRHILKIEIEPRRNKKINSLIKSHKKEEEEEVKSSSGDFDEFDDRKMSVVSRVNCNSSNKSSNKSVTIIRHEELESNSDSHLNGYEDGNLSDDQKLVVLNGVVTCNSGSSRSEMIGNVGRIILSGHCSPCGGSGDSGTCSDVEVNGRRSSSPPPLPPKTYKLKMIDQKLSESTCSDASSASSDSMQYHQLVSPELIRTISNASSSQDYESSHPPPQTTSTTTSRVSFMLPTSLLQDIRNHSATDLNYEEEEEELRSENEELLMDDDEELNYSDIVICRNSSDSNNDISSKNNNNDNRRSDIEFYDDDKFYKFHINENFSSMSLDVSNSMHEESDESFAGIKDLRSGTSTIRSNKGTIRGVKNRVRNGIATFQQQMQQTTVKNYKEKDGGKIVLYTTSMGVVRSTYAKCQAMKQILRTLMVKFEERDVFMSYSHQQDIRDRMQNDDIEVPQLFVDGQYVGNADQVERLNETGELRTMLKPYKCRDSFVTCKLCGGYKMLPCPSCGGSKKSIHRNHFTTEFIALKCMNCDEVGLVKCYNC